MSVIAIYENGVLRPLEPLALPEHTRVQVQVQRVLSPEDVAEHRLRVREIMIAAGLSLSDAPAAPSSPISAERCEELATRFATGQPLSELLIAEREGR
jgi:predicted DNA-binding antitoxin AbrB/MazE fold protein